MPGPQPVEIHRRHVSLRDRLIKGVTTPQNIGMRAYKQRKGLSVWTDIYR